MSTRLLGDMPVDRKIVPLEARRRSIVDAARHLLTTQGLGGTTISRIATQAGMSQGGLYRHFASHMDIMIAVLDAIFEERRAAWPTERGLSGLEMLRRAGQFHLAQMESNTSFMAPFIELVSHGGQQELREAILNHQYAALARLREVIDQGKADGSIRQDIDSEGLAFQFASWTWGPALAYAIGISEFCSRGHSLRLLGLLLRDAANEPRLAGPSEAVGRDG